MRQAVNRDDTRVEVSQGVNRVGEFEVAVDEYDSNNEFGNRSDNTYGNLGR